MSVEGIEGSGKSTLVTALAKRLEGSGIRIVVTREPGGTPLGDRLRGLFVARDVRIDPMAEAFIVNAARAQHVAEVIRPALAGGAWVVSDRFAASTLAYQGYGRGVDLTTLRRLTDVAADGLTPDLTIVVDVPVDVSRRRVRERIDALGGGPDRLDVEGDDFHARVRNAYLTLASADPAFAVLDGTRAPLALTDAACDVIAARFRS